MIESGLLSLGGYEPRCPQLSLARLYAVLPAAATRATRGAETRQTAVTPEATRPSSHGSERSVPASRRCTVAPSQTTSVSTWARRHAPCGSLLRSAFVTATAASSSAAATPSPTANGRYDELNGTSSWPSEIGTTRSSSSDPPWITMKTPVSRAAKRCTSSTAKRGHPSLARVDSNRPSTTDPVRRTYAVIPAERAAYQSAPLMRQRGAGPPGATSR